MGELAFWEMVYVAACQSGLSHVDSVGRADAATEARRARQPIDAKSAVQGRIRTANELDQERERERKNERYGNDL